MNLKYILFNNQYCESPKIFLHKIHPYSKISAVFTFLCILIFMKNKMIIYLFFIILLLYSYYKLYYQYIQQLIGYILLYFLYTFFLMHQNIYSFIKHIKINIPYNLGIKCQFLKNEKLYIIINYLYKEYILPYSILRISLILLIYFATLQLLKISTPYEFNNIYFLYIIKISTKHKKNFHNHFSVSLFLTNQFIDRILVNIHFIQLSIILKYNSLYQDEKNKQIIYKSIKQYIKNVFDEIKYILVYLYNKKISLNNFYFFK